jgi:uncharacterized protein YjbJ (UPF0337 family)
MDQDRVKGSFKQIIGKFKEWTGRLVGDAKLKTEGKTEQAVGKVQNAYGGAKDKVRDA